MLKKQLLLLIFLFSFSSLWANVQDDKYNIAIKLYKSEKYEEAQNFLVKLVEDEYTNEFIYFLLGSTGRYLREDDSKQDNLKQHNIAITNLEKYLEYYIPEKNEIVTKINLAYEYAKGPPANKGHSSDKGALLKKSKEMVEELKSNSQYEEKYSRLWKKILYCHSTIFNKYAYHLIEEDVEIKEPKEYYIKIEKILKESIKSRDDNILAVGNLTYVYFRIMEFNLKSKNRKDFNDYHELVKNLIEEHDFLQDQSTVKNYLSKLEDDAKKIFKA